MATCVVRRQQGAKLTREDLAVIRVIREERSRSRSKPAPATSPTLPAVESTCCVCLAEPAVACCTRGVHGTCAECFVRSARVALDEEPARLRQERGGRLVCPCFRPELGGCGGWFTERTIARWLDEADYARYDALRQAEVRRRVWLEMNERVEKTVHEMARRLQQSAPQLPKRLLAEQLRMSIPGARMCGRCRHGPIEHFACSDLRTHRHESYAGNACPKCGWFAGDIACWPRWDGNVPDSAVAPASLASFASAAGGVVGSVIGGAAGSAAGGAAGLPSGAARPPDGGADLALAERMRCAEELRLRQIAADGKYARRLHQASAPAPQLHGLF